MTTPRRTIPSSFWLPPNDTMKAFYFLRCGMELEEKQKPAKKRGVLAVILVLLIAAIGVFVVYY